MNASKSQNELLDLFDALFVGAITPPEHERLQKLLADDPAARRIYFDYLDMHLHLRRWQKAEAAAELRDEGQDKREQGMVGSPTIDSVVGAEVEHPVVAAVELPQQLDPESQTPNPPFPTLSTTNYPLPATPFVESWAFACMVATVILCVAALVAWVCKVTHHQHIAEAPSQSVPSEAMPEMVFVGRITGAVGVKWSDDPNYLPPLGFGVVPLGRKYILDSGLMEITYDSGAKVILQGPCTYEVESTAGGYLALGKLTARVGAGGGGRETGGEDVSHYPLSTTHYPLFSVRTPTAVVTDLGTEFGVEVSEEGTTTSRVFRGSVKVQVVGGTGLASATPREVILRENESARVEMSLEGRAPRIVSESGGGWRRQFVRELRRPRTPSSLQILAHYRFGEDDPGSARDTAAGKETADRGRLRPLETHGSPTYVEGGVPGSSLAMRFNNAYGDSPIAPTQYCERSAPGQLFPTDNNWGFDFWMKVNSLPGPKQDPEAAFVQIGGTGLPDAGGDGPSVMVEGYNGRFSLHNQGYNIVTMDYAVPVGVWMHVCYINDDKLGKFYVNGERIALDVTPGAMNLRLVAPHPDNVVDRIVVGADYTVAGNGNAARYVRGADVEIDELRLFTFQPRQFNIRDVLAGGGEADDAPSSESPPGNPEKGGQPMNGS